MRLIKNINRNRFRKRIAKTRAQLKFEYDREVNENLQQYKNSLEAIIKRQEAENKIKDDYHKKELENIREFERNKYIPKLDEKQKEIDRLQGIIDERRQLYGAIVNKEIDFQEKIDEIGEKLSRGMEKIAKGIGLIETALDFASVYNKQQKKLDNKLAEIKGE